MTPRRRREEGEEEEEEALYAGPDSSGMAREGDVELNGGGRHKGGVDKGKRGVAVVEGEKENLVGLFRALSRKLSSSVAAREKEDDTRKCLICLEPLTEEDFASGEVGLLLLLLLFATHWLLTYTLFFPLAQPSPGDNAAVSVQGRHSSPPQGVRGEVGLGEGVSGVRHLQNHDSKPS